jgi:DNA-3-methyladenine glycosylase
MAKFKRSFYAQASHVVAPLLLGAVLRVGDLSGRIVEVEAYGGTDDAASHAFRGQTARNAVMFGPPGHLYVYFTYGMHFCANVVTGPIGDGQAVLIRAVEPIDGIARMRIRREKALRDRDLTNGPAKLCQAFGLGRNENGSDLLAPECGISIAAPSVLLDESTVAVGPRIGITKEVDRQWRFWIADNEYVSR